MIATSRVRSALAAALTLLVFDSAKAATIGYAQAIDQLAKSCGADIAKFCRQAGLGGGRVLDCLSQSQAVSPRCRSTLSQLQALLQKRAAARASVPRICGADIRKVCSGVQAGDGNLMECFYKAKQNISPSCRQAVADAGYEVGLAPTSSRGPIQLSSAKLVETLQGIESAGSTITTARLRQLAAQAINDPSRAARSNREPLTNELERLAQFTIAVQFDLNSARIRPDSFRAVGLMADALNHPYLQGYRFLVVGHTDAKGDRQHNLNLSQRRAEAIRDALINPFGINPARIEAVGLGEEQLLDRSNPEAAKNRRVQLINVGR